MIDETELHEQPKRGNQGAPSNPYKALGGRTLQEWQSDHHMVWHEKSAEKEWIPRRRGGPVFRYVR